MQRPPTQLNTHTYSLKFKGSRLSFGPILPSPLQLSSNNRPMMGIHMFTVLLGLLLLRSTVAAGCGNGVWDAGENCDDGNSLSGDGCSAACLMEEYYDCTAAPSVCKVDALISLSPVGIDRAASSNTATLLFKLNYQLSLFTSINFNTIFTTSIVHSGLLVEYLADSNLLKVTVAYSSTLEDTRHTFKLMLTTTTRFWYDSVTCQFQLQGANCELTFEDDFWLQGAFSYALLAVTVISMLVGLASMLWEKWIGLELIQTYQSVYYLLLLLPSCPFEFTPLAQTLIYSSGFDDIITQDYLRSYTLPNQLLMLGINKEYVENINVGLCLVGGVLVALVVLAVYKGWLKHRLESEINRDINKRIDKVSKYFRFMFGEVFVMLVLTLMFKVISSFAVQLSQETEAYPLFLDEINSILGLFSFLILFSIIIYILNWYTLIPDTLTERDVFSLLQFRNMKFSYPVIYLVYQAVFITLISIFYRRSFALYIILAIQAFYLGVVVCYCPYNTPRKINRILHNVTILFNQCLLTCVTALTFRWRTLLSSYQSSNSTEFHVYLFAIFALLVCSTILTIVRLCIFDKDVQCCAPRDDEEDGEEMGPLKGKAASGRPLMEEVELVRKGSKEQEPDLTDQFSPRKDDSGNDKLSQFLNDKYSNWKRDNSEELLRAKKRNRPRRIKGTTDKLADLIKTPLDEFKEMKLNEARMNAENQQQ